MITHGFYPGNNYVDWIGIDTYQRSATATFADDFGLFYVDFSNGQYATKPLHGQEKTAHKTSHRTTASCSGLISKEFFPDCKLNRYPQLTRLTAISMPARTPKLGSRR